MIYFDNAATSLVNREVLDIFNKLTLQLIGNPSSNHHLGFQALEYENKAAKQILNLLKIPSYELVFTSGASEGNNFLIQGIVKRNFRQGKKIITSKVEHPSVLEVFKQLEKEGYQAVYLDVDRYGNLDYSQLEANLDDSTILVSLMSTNNEVGFNFDIEKISKLVHSKSKAYFISDVTQGIGKTDIDYSCLDGFAMSGHKIGGLKSSGFVCFKKNLKINGLILGGGQQDNYRSGTINAPLNCSLAAGLRIYLNSYPQRKKQAKILFDRLYDKLSKYPMLFHINTNRENSSNFIFNFSLLTSKASVVVESLSSKEVYVSTTSACSSKKEQFSSCLKAMGYNDVISQNSIRVSFEGNEDIKQVDDFVSILLDVVNNIKRR